MSMDAWIAVRNYASEKGARLVLLWMIADQTRDEFNNATVRIDTLAALSRLHRQEVIKYLGDLAKHGDLVMIKHLGKRTDYYIPILPDEPGYAPERCTDARHTCNGNHTPLSITREHTRQLGRGTKGSTSVRQDNSRGTKGSTTGVPREVPQGYQGKYHRGTKGSTTTPLLSLTLPYGDTYTRTRASTPNLAVKMEEEAEMPLPSAPSPSPELADGPEQRAMWRSVQTHMVERGVSPGQMAVMSSCHLYRLGPGMWRLRVPPGYDRGMFRTRYEDLIIDGISSQAQRGNQIVEFAS